MQCLCVLIGLHIKHISSSVGGGKSLAWNAFVTICDLKSVTDQTIKSVIWRVAIQSVVGVLPQREWECLQCSSINTLFQEVIEVADVNEEGLTLLNVILNHK